LTSIEKGIIRSHHHLHATFFFAFEISLLNNFKIMHHQQHHAARSTTTTTTTTTTAPPNRTAGFLVRGW